MRHSVYHCYLYSTLTLWSLICRVINSLMIEQERGRMREKISQKGWKCKREDTWLGILIRPSLLRHISPQKRSGERLQNWGEIYAPQSQSEALPCSTFSGCFRSHSPSCGWSSLCFVHISPRTIFIFSELFFVWCFRGWRWSGVSFECTVKWRN